MDLQQIKKFASEACTIIDNYQTMVNTLMSKQASVDTAKIEKAANAVYEAYGRPAKISVDSIVEFWGSNPSAMADTITKLASEKVESGKLTGSAIGTSMPKKASATDETVKADDAFWSKYC